MPHALITYGTSILSLLGLGTAAYYSLIRLSDARERRIEPRIISGSGIPSDESSMPEDTPERKLSTMEEIARIESDCRGEHIVRAQPVEFPELPEGMRFVGLADPFDEEAHFLTRRPLPLIHLDKERDHDFGLKLRKDRGTSFVVSYKGCDLMLNFKDRNYHTIEVDGHLVQAYVLEGTSGVLFYPVTFTNAALGTTYVIRRDDPASPFAFSTHEVDELVDMVTGNG